MNRGRKSAIMGPVKKGGMGMAGADRFLPFVLAALLLLAGCGAAEEQARETLDAAESQAQEKLNDTLEWVGGKIVGALDELENAEYQGKSEDKRS